MALILFLICASSLVSAAESGPVTVGCTESERELFFPQSEKGKPVWHEPGMVSQAMLCRTIKHALDLSTDALYKGRIQSAVSHDCWQAIAKFWSGAKLDRKPPGSQVESTEFLRTELGAFIDTMTQASSPSATEACFIFTNPEQEIRGHIRSFQETLAARVQQLQCSKSEIDGELEIWAKRKLESYYSSPIYDNCKSVKGGSRSKLNSCEKMRQDLIALLRKKGSLNYQSCIDSVSELKGPKASSWTQTAHTCASGAYAMAKENYMARLEEIQARKNGYTLVTDVGRLNEEFKIYKPCSALESECRNNNITALEENTGLCPIPNGLGKQTGGTCAFHAISAAIYLGSKNCDKNYSIGQLQNMAGMEQPWDTTKGFGAKNLPDIEKALAVKGVALKEYREPLTNITRVPMLVTVRVGELKTDLLIRDKEADSTAKDPAFHALLVTTIITQTVKGVVTKMAVIRDANAGYAPYLIPLDQLTQANQYYAREACPDPTTCAPPAIEVGRR